MSRSLYLRMYDLTYLIIYRDDEEFKEDNIEEIKANIDMKKSEKSSDCRKKVKEKDKAKDSRVEVRLGLKCWPTK